MRAEASLNQLANERLLAPWASWPGERFAIADYRDIVMVAGQDPYAWKGTEDRASAHVRPSGEGGCGNAERNVEARPAMGAMAAMGEDDDHDD